MKTNYFAVLACLAFLSVGCGGSGGSGSPSPTPGSNPPGGTPPGGTPPGGTPPGNTPPGNTPPGTTPPGTTPPPAPGVTGKAGVDGGVCAVPAQITPFGTATRTVGDGTPASCTEAALRTAVAAGGKIAFACGAAEKTITLTSVIEVNVSADLEGAGRVVLSGGQTTRLFTVMGRNRVLTLRNITIRDGYFNNITSTSGADRDNRGAGGIHVNPFGGIIAENVKFLNNISVRGGGLGGERNGGAVSTHESPVAVFYNSLFQGNGGHLGSGINNLLTNLEVVNSSFLDNRTFDEGFGGAIYSDGGFRTYDNPNAVSTSPYTSNGTINVCGSLFSGNRGGYSGGAMYTCGYANDQTTVDRSLIKDNYAGDNVKRIATGGGIASGCNGRLTVKNSTIANNTVKGYGGGIWQNIGSSSSGPPLNRLVLLNSTITGNITTLGPKNGVDAEGKDTYDFGDGGVGGGVLIDNQDSPAVLNNVTITNNTSGRGGGVFLKEPNRATGTNLIIANNQSTNAFNQMKNCSALFETASALIEFPARTSPECAAAPLGTDPRLAGVALADNGGPTPTLMPPANSSALGIGASCETNDQRGTSRAGRCDAGAVLIKTTP